MAAAAGGHTDVVTALLDAGADINARDKDQEMALHLPLWKVMSGRGRPSPARG
jgi:ankyrin repeat protein